jgi:hypothetical protein
MASLLSLANSKNSLSNPEPSPKPFKHQPQIFTQILTSKHPRQIKLITIHPVIAIEARKMQKQNGNKTRVFSVELKSKRNLKNLTLTNGSQDSVLLEGSIGELVAAKFAEDVILEVIGKDGILRIDLRENEIEKSKPPSEVKEQ